MFGRSAYVRTGVLSTLLLAVCVIIAGATWTQADSKLSGNDGFGFGKQVAGTYIDEGEIPCGSTFRGLQTLNVDGTQSSTNTNCCGAAGNLQTEGHGVWKKTGTHQITLTTIILLFDLDGTPFAIDSGRVTSVVDFDDDFETATGQITTELFLAGTDPLEDEPFLVVNGFHDWRRVHVVEDPVWEPCPEE